MQGMTYIGNHGLLQSRATSIKRSERFLNRVYKKMVIAVWAKKATVDNGRGSFHSGSNGIPAQKKKFSGTYGKKNPDWRIPAKTAGKIGRE